MSEIDAVTIHEGSANVFADIGLPNAAEFRLKSDLTANLRRLIEANRLTQTKAAGLLGIGQGDLSKLLRGSLRGYSAERLMGFITVFEQDVEITIRPRPKTGEKGRISVMRATA